MNLQATESQYKTKKVAKAVVMFIVSILAVMLTPIMAFASEADLKIPELAPEQNNLLYIGLGICVLGMLFGLYQFLKVKKIKAHKSMLDVSNTIF